jgi:hypothetical protein
VFFHRINLPPYPCVTLFAIATLILFSGSKNALGYILGAFSQYHLVTLPLLNFAIAASQFDQNCLQEAKRKAWGRMTKKTRRVPEK